MAKYYPTQAVINVGKIQAILHERIGRAVEQVSTNAYDQARIDVPVRKVFRYGRNKAGLRIAGRQDVRLLSISEALSEKSVRRRLFLAGFSGTARQGAIRRGVGSAFPTDAAGRRLRNSQPVVRTAQISETYRSRDRANTWNERRREIQRFEDVVDDRGRVFDRRPIKPRLESDEAQSDLSVRGRYELKRYKGPTLGGALRRSIVRTLAFRGSVMTAYISAGNDEVDYAKYVEFGTRRSRAQPFMRPAKAKAREEFPQLLRDALRGMDITGGSRR